MRRLLGNIKTTIGKYKLLTITLVVGAFFLITLLVLRSANIKYEEQQDRYGLRFMDKVVPGTDNQASLEKKLGFSDNEIQTGDTGKVLTYKNKNVPGNWSSQIYLDKDNNVYLTIERVTSEPILTQDELTKDFDKEDSILYGPTSPIYNLFVYTQQGVAILASTNPDTVSEVWTFQPMPLDEFIKEIASKFGYSQQPYDFKGND